MDYSGRVQIVGFEAGIKPVKFVWEGSQIVGSHAVPVVTLLSLSSFENSIL